MLENVQTQTVHHVCVHESTKSTSSSRGSGSYLTEGVSGIRSRRSTCIMVNGLCEVISDHWTVECTFYTISKGSEMRKRTCTRCGCIAEIFLFC